MALLTDEYDDHFSLIHVHIHEFAEIPMIRSESIADLRGLRDRGRCFSRRVGWLGSTGEVLERSSIFHFAEV